MFAKSIFPLSFLTGPHSYAFSSSSPPPPILLKKVLFQSYVSATTVQPHPFTETEPHSNTWTLGWWYQGDGDATATIAHDPAANCENCLILQPVKWQHWQKAVELLRRVLRYLNSDKVWKNSHLTTYKIASSFRKESHVLPKHSTLIFCL